MPREKRCEAFLLNPNAILTDPDFQAMDHRSQRAYLMLVLLAWNEKEAGVLPYDQKRLAYLVGVSPRAWRVIEPQLLRAIKVRQDGSWYFAAMIETKSRQDLWISRAKKGANSRWHNKTTHAQAMLTGSGSGAVEASSPASNEAVEEAQPDPRDLVLNLASKLGPPKPLTFPDKEAWDWITNTMRSHNPNEAFKFMKWAWKGGVHSLDAIKLMCFKVVREQIRNPYAYFSKNGDARSSIVDSDSILAAQKDHKALLAKEIAWLKNQAP